MSAAGIDATNKQLSAAVARGDAAGAAACYAEDGCFLPPNSDFVQGREAIQGFWQGAIDMGIKELRLATNEIEILGDTATEVGTYQLMADGGVQADHGKFLVVWKNCDGQWLLHRDMINTSMPAPE